MDPTAAKIVESLAGAAAAATIAGSVAVWVHIARRKRRSLPLIPFEPRRPVPWSLLDVVFLLGMYFVFAGAAFFFAQNVLHWKFSRPSPPTVQLADEEQDELDRAHPVVVLLAEKPGAGSFLLCVFAVIVMAPLAEEFFFRLLLQGWFEKFDFTNRRLLHDSSRMFGVLPILLSSLMFAAPHARGAEAPPPPDFLMKMLALDSVVKVVLLIFAIVHLRVMCGAKREDFGLRLDRLPQDVLLALGTFAAMIVPVYAIQLGLSHLLPGVVADPVPLFFFALGLGYLYLRTHRLTPAILLHMIFNAAALAIFFAGIAQR